MKKYSIFSIIAVLIAVLAWFVVPSFAKNADGYTGCSRYTWCTHYGCRCPQFLEAPGYEVTCRCGHMRSEHNYSAY